LPAATALRCRQIRRNADAVHPFCPSCAVQAPGFVSRSNGFLNRSNLGFVQDAK
jgi:hypothetical protein